MGHALTCALAALALLAAPVAAKGQPQPVSLQVERGFYLSPLDIQGCWACDPPWYVYNPSGTGPTPPPGEPPTCAWNDQDDILLSGGGYVDGTMEFPMCLFADWDETTHGNMPHSVYVNVYAASDSLAVGLRNDAGDTWQAGPSTAWGNQRLWRICTPDPVADRANSPPLSYWPEVPGSNGGRAQRVTYTLTLTALGRRARDVWVNYEIAGSGPTWAAPRLITNCP